MKILCSWNWPVDSVNPNQWHNIVGVCVLKKIPGSGNICSLLWYTFSCTFIHKVLFVFLCTSLQCKFSGLCEIWEINFKLPTTAGHMKQIWKTQWHPSGFTHNVHTNHHHIFASIMQTTVNDIKRLSLFTSAACALLYTCISWPLSSSWSFYIYHIQDGCEWLWGRLMVLG